MWEHVYFRIVCTSDASDNGKWGRDHWVIIANVHICLSETFISALCILTHLILLYPLAFAYLTTGNLVVYVNNNHLLFLMSLGVRKVILLEWARLGPSWLDFLIHFCSAGGSSSLDDLEWSHSHVWHLFCFWLGQWRWRGPVSGHSAGQPGLLTWQSQGLKISKRTNLSVQAHSKPLLKSNASHMAREI